MRTALDCSCECHDGAKIWCSCFSPCCSESYKLVRWHQRLWHRIKQFFRKPPPPPPVEDIKIGDFTKFVFPRVKGKWPELIPPP